MKNFGIHSLMYHDVYDPARTDRRPDRYSVSVDVFRQHMKAVGDRKGSAPALLRDSSFHAVPGQYAITFDDGTSGSLQAAEILESQGWRGHFFVVTDFIGRPGYMDVEGIRVLHRNGHVIGSHSASHPATMAALEPSELLSQWERSVDHLSDILQERVKVAAIPGGSYSREVARMAARAGVEILFTSEPSSRPRPIEGCLVVGRYTIRSNITAAEAAALASGGFAPRAKQFLGWNSRKAAKTVAGSHYNTIRKRLLRR